MMVTVSLKERTYDIHILPEPSLSLADFFGSHCKSRKALFVADNNTRVHADTLMTVAQHAGIQNTLLVIQAGEDQKNLNTVSRLYDQLASMQADRQTAVVAVGGGVIGDLAGFAAATYNRGLPLVMVPTTLLAMVDSSVGGKTGVNHAAGKNLIGAFHQPCSVWIDPAFLATLGEREFRSGLAEVVKYGMILDANLFSGLTKFLPPILARDSACLRDIVTICCRLKGRVVEQDEREEKEIRVILNYGHTFAHAFEATLGYGSWQHGEAVSAGMVCASLLALRRGIVPRRVLDSQVELLSAIGLPTMAPRVPAATLLQAMRSDKKAKGGQLRFVLPQAIGQVAVYSDIRDSEVLDVLMELGATA